MNRRKHNQVEGEDKAEIDLTPMLDVVFIMLIFFIVTASFIKEKSLATNVPDENKKTETSADSDSILIQVNANDEIYIDQRRVDVRSVRSLIAQRSAENPEAGVVVRAHEQSTTQTYIAIADASREAKIFNVSLVPYSE